MQKEANEATNNPFPKSRWREKGVVLLPFPHYVDRDIDGDSYHRTQFERQAFKKAWLANAPFSGDLLAKTTLAAVSASTALIGAFVGNFADHSTIEKQEDKLVPAVRVDADLSQPKLLTGIFSTAGLLLPVAASAACATLRARRYSIAASSQYVWEHDPY